MIRYKEKRTYLLEIDSWKISGAIGAMKANPRPVLYDLKRDKIKLSFCIFEKICYTMVTITILIGCLFDVLVLYDMGLYEALIGIIIRLCYRADRRRRLWTAERPAN